jgi:hypothetical protein
VRVFSLPWLKSSAYILGFFARKLLKKIVNYIPDHGKMDGRIIQELVFFLKNISADELFFSFLI